MYKSVRAERLYQQIADQIERRILAGELKIGKRLPAEWELGQQFGASRTAVREAVKVLHQKGLVDVQPGRGTFITNGTSQTVRHSLGLLTRIGGDDGLSALVEVRELLEPEIAALAAVRATREQITAMLKAVAAMDAALPADGDAYVEADLDFHRGLARATGNPLILTLIDSIVDLLREQRIRIFQTSGAAERGQLHHKAIVTAIMIHRPDTARETMRAHLSQVRQDSQASTAQPA
jgi:GntR family transcriptional repressor for pyruvate dehydrogenase complex